MTKKLITDIDIDFTIDTDNAAFEDDLEFEVKGILEKAIENISFEEDRNHILRDTNGNNVGNVKVTIYRGEFDKIGIA